MKILGIDFETTGLEFNKDRVIEVGAVVWDTDNQKPLAMQSELVKPENFTAVPEEIVRITGISTDMVEEYGVTPEAAFIRLIELAKKADYLVAHNAGFDRSFFESELKNLGLDIPDTPWICTLQDVPYPSSIVTRKLSYLAAEHKILNPYSHRAVFDVLTMLDVLKNYKIDEVVQRSKSPSVKVTAIVSFEEKDKAKNLGFRWDGSNKTWSKSYKECDIESVQFPFEVRVENQSVAPMM